MATKSNPQATPPLVFVSYAHETPDHKNWVRSLATDLRKNGVNTLLDDWKVGLGADFTLFMDQIRKSERVLLICTPAYARKSNEGEGGVGYERSVITTDLAKKISTSKFVCVLRDGDAQKSIPIFYGDRRYVDFRDDSEYEVRLEELLRDLLNAPADPEPALGENPFLQHELPAKDATESQDNISQIVSQAERLLSKGEMLGWKRLLRRARRDVHPRLSHWRETVGQNIESDEKWITQFDDGVRVAEPLMALALTAVDSEIPSIRNQIGLLDDLLDPEGWNPCNSSAVCNVCVW